jgi:flagellar L-ring protein precursor FlgH
MKKVICYCIPAFLGCSVSTPPPKSYPALEYTNAIKAELGTNQFERARVSFANQETEVTNMPNPAFTVEESKAPLTRDYQSPLPLGDPGIQASLWRESRRGTFLFQDHRAWQAMDLITIVVSENMSGSTDADTQITTESGIEATFEQLLGVPQYLLNKIDTYITTGEDGNADTSKPLVKGGSKSRYKGEGETKRTGALRGKISAMVVEVLPAGILRIEGKKIVSVNEEDQVMVISGLVRPSDVNSNNEVDSSKIANMRIDFFGKGTVGDAQHGGWLGNIVRRLWPF